MLALASRNDLLYPTTMRRASRRAPGVEKGVPRPKSSAVQIAIRIPPEWIVEAEALSKLMSQPGVTVTRSDALRVAISKGLRVLRAELEMDRQGRQ